MVAVIDSTASAAQERSTLLHWHGRLLSLLQNDYQNHNDDDDENNSDGDPEPQITAGLHRVRVATLRIHLGIHTIVEEKLVTIMSYVHVDVAIQLTSNVFKAVLSADGTHIIPIIEMTESALRDIQFLQLFPLFVARNQIAVHTAIRAVHLRNCSIALNSALGYSVGILRSKESAEADQKRGLAIIEIAVVAKLDRRDGGRRGSQLDGVHGLPRYEVSRNRSVSQEEVLYVPHTTCKATQAQLTVRWRDRYAVAHYQEKESSEKGLHREMEQTRDTKRINDVSSFPFLP